MLGGFWQSVLESDMAVPRERPLNELTAELVSMLGSPDAIERDEVAYSVLATWITEGVYDDLLVTLGNSIAEGLRSGLGGPADDTVFRRSFCALVLAECVGRDNVAHLLPVDAVMGWADCALNWFVREQDLRGWVDAKGWAHTVAHGADLISALAQSRHLTAPHLGVLLDVIAERLLSTDGIRLVHGEDDRLAAATLTILQRNLVEVDQLEDWVESLGAGIQPPSHSDPGTWPSMAARNTSDFLRALYVHLAVGARPAGTVLDFSEPPDCRADLLLSLLRVMPALTPWLNPTVATAPATGAPTRAASTASAPRL